ncbi:MAG: hypothetical protein ABW185_19985 [Sedimenticola sp.]
MASIEAIEEGDLGHLYTVPGEGRLSQNEHQDLGSDFPTFSHDDHVTVLGSPSGEVRLRVPHDREHLVQSRSVIDLDRTNKSSDDQNNENLRAEMSALKSQFQILLLELRVAPDPQAPVFSTEQESEGNRRDGLQQARRNQSYHSPRVNDIQRDRLAYEPYHEISRPTNTNINMSNRYRSLSPRPRDCGVQSDRGMYNDHNQRPTRFDYAPSFTPRNNKSELVKIGTYDGTGSWHDYWVQFGIAARGNNWDNETQAIKLACSLRGAAQSILSELDSRYHTDFNALVSALTDRFQPGNQSTLYKAQMKQRLRRKDEPLPELAQDIKRLTRLAYPSLPSDHRQDLALDCFIEAINDWNLEQFITMKEPQTIEEGLRIAMKYEAAKFRNGRQTARQGIRMQSEICTGTNVDHQTKLLRECSDVLREIKSINKKQNGTGSNTQVPDHRVCYRCQQPGHIACDCPNFRQSQVCQYCNQQGHFLDTCPYNSEITPENTQPNFHSSRNHESRLGRGLPQPLARGPYNNNRNSTNGTPPTHNSYNSSRGRGNTRTYTQSTTRQNPQPYNHQQNQGNWN